MSVVVVTADENRWRMAVDFFFQFSYLIAYFFPSTIPYAVEMLMTSWRRLIMLWPQCQAQIQDGIKDWSYDKYKNTGKDYDRDIDDVHWW